MQTKTQYVEQATLAAGWGDEPRAISSLLVGTHQVAEFEEGHRETGHYLCRVFPAWHEGDRSWMVSRLWCAGAGYSATSYEEQVLDFQTGVALLVEHGAYGHMFPTPTVAASLTEAPR